ncbi:hypothetical protein R6Q57_024631 [Mikania cordata]
MDIACLMAMVVFRAKKFIKEYTLGTIRERSWGSTRAGTSKALVTQESDAYDLSDEVQELEMSLSHAFIAEVDEKHNDVTENKLEAERHGISKLKELLSDKESNYWDAQRRIDEITLELNQVKTGLSKTNIRAEKYDYTSNLVANIINVEVRGRKGKGLGYSEVEPPFNNNYFSMPRINTSVYDLILKSNRGHESLLVLASQFLS